MIFISKRQFECEVRERVERAMMEESRRRDFYKLNDEVNELAGRVYALEREVFVHKPPVSGTTTLSSVPCP